MLLSGSALAQDRLIYDCPAFDGSGAFLLGNGRMSVLVSGGPEDESIHFPHGALRLRQELVCDTVLTYRRTLDLPSATATADFSTRHGGLYSRSVFFSRPAQALVINLRSRSEIPLDFSIEVDSLWTSAQLDSLSEEQFEIRTEADGDAYRYRVHLISTDGEYGYSSGLRVRGARTATVLVVASAAGKQEERAAAAEEAMRISQTKSFRQLHEEHSASFAELYGRVALELKDIPPLDMMTTDARISRYASGAEDLGLEELYFRYERYLSVSKSEVTDSENYPQVRDFSYTKLRSLISESGFSPLSHADVIPGVFDMLVQSRDDGYVILPSLPSAWRTGSVNGLKLPDSSVVHMEWRSGVFEQAFWQCSGKPCVLRTVRPVAVGRKGRGRAVCSHMEQTGTHYRTEVSSVQGDVLYIVSN